MSLGKTHTHYSVGDGYDYADVALVCLFVTFRHHPIFPQFLQIFHDDDDDDHDDNGRHLSIGNAHMEPSSGGGCPVADGAVGPTGRSCDYNDDDDDDDNDTFNFMLKIMFEEPLSSYTGIVVLVGE